MTAATAPIATAAEQEQHQNDNQDQFHGISPLTAMALMRRSSQANEILEGLFHGGNDVARESLKVPCRRRRPQNRTSLEPARRFSRGEFRKVHCLSLIWGNTSMLTSVEGPGLRPTRVYALRKWAM